MIVIGKIVSSKTVNFITFKDDKQAFLFLDENTGTEDIELFVDISEVKHYRDRYFEAYKTLFNNFSTNPVINEIDSDLVTSVKYYDINDKIERIKTFTSYNKAKDFIDDELLDVDDFGSIQVLVNIAQVLDYKEKYNEFYQILLDKAQDKDF